MNKKSNVLKQKDSKLFFSSYLKLLIYVNNKQKIVPLNPNETEQYLRHLCEIRDLIFENNNIKLIGDFLNHYSGELNKEEKLLIQDWKRYGVFGKFYILKHYKTYSVFMDYDDPRKLYKVIGITDPMAEICPPENLPTIVKTALLPFNNEIIFDGLVSFDNIYLGSNITKNLNEDYQINKSKYDLISDLHTPTDFSNPNIEKLLKKYIQKPDYYDIEIDNLIEESDENYVLYTKLLAEKYVRHYKKIKKELGIKDKYYVAVHFDHIISIASTKKEVSEQINKIVPSENQPFVHIFKV